MAHTAELSSPGLTVTSSAFVVGIVVAGDAVLSTPLKQGGFGPWTSVRPSLVRGF